MQDKLSLPAVQRRYRQLCQRLAQSGWICEIIIGRYYYRPIDRHASLFACRTNFLYPQCSAVTGNCASGWLKPVGSARATCRTGDRALAAPVTNGRVRCAQKQLALPSQRNNTNGLKPPLPIGDGCRKPSRKCRSFRAKCCSQRCRTRSEEHTS